MCYIHFSVHHNVRMGREWHATFCYLTVKLKPGRIQHRPILRGNAHLDDKCILKNHSSQPWDVGGEGLPGQVRPRMDVQVDLHVVGPKIELVLRPREHRLVIVVRQQPMLCAAQGCILRPLLHVCHPGDQLEPVPGGRPAWPHPQDQTLHLAIRACRKAHLPTCNPPNYPSCLAEHSGSCL